MEFPDVDPTRTGELRTRPRRAETRSRDAPTPKKRMLGPTPSIFCKVDAPKTPKEVFGDPQKIFVYRVGAKSDKKKGYHFFERYEKDKAKRAKKPYKKNVSEQPYKKTLKSHEKCSL